MLTPVLPRSRNRQWLAAFLLAFSLCAGVLSAAIAGFAGLKAWPLHGVGVALVLTVPGLVRLEAVALPYAVWNRLAREYTGLARRLLGWICYHTLFLSVGWTRSALVLDHPGREASLWVPRTSARPEGSESVDGLQASDTKGWLRGLLSWSRRSGNPWVFCFIPCLV